MSKLIEKSIDTMKEGVDSLKNIKRDKAEYKKYIKRIEALPDEYKFAFEKMTKYMWNFSGGGSGYDMISVQSDLLELFETSVADGKELLDLTGEDIASFCDELLRSTNTYTKNQHDKLNRDIKKHLEKN